ncbi:MAG: DNA recombination protein RmuC [Candidatus Parcubacteria bacterium]|nr:DNA recombination protein RmuC [Candidatus Parcubacteria bacterium]
MQIFLIILSIIIIAGIITVIILLTKNKPIKDDQSLLMLQNQLNELSKVLSEGLNVNSKTISDGLNNTHKSMQQQFGQTAKIVQDVTEKLTKLDETNKQVVGFAEQLQSLENILTNPKQRGILGEYFLEQLLKNVMPPASYEMQYKFKNGEIVDAVIFVKDKIIPIDSKFSLENYNKIVVEKDPTAREQLEKLFKIDLKNRIDETSKYIRPSERTMDFAFMFIPSEGIYYDLLINQVGAIKVNTRDLIEYAFKEKHVIITSPTSFFAYLQTVLQGLKALQIEKSAQQIRERVEQLQKHLLAYDSYLLKLGNNLGTTVGMYNSAYKEFKKIDKDVVRITGVAGEIEPLELDKPQS